MYWNVTYSVLNFDYYKFGCRCVQFNFSLIDCAHLWDIKLNTNWEIPCLVHSVLYTPSNLYACTSIIKFVLWGKFIFWCLCCRLKLISTYSSSMIYHFFCVSFWYWIQDTKRWKSRLKPFDLTFILLHNNNYN